MRSRPEARLNVAVRGAVQGVGFRPFVYRLATELGLNGWVNNSPQGVFLEVEGRRADAENFLRRLETEKPPRSSIQHLETRWLPPAKHQGFEIRESRIDGNKTAIVLPDIATCPECLRELFDPHNRRYLYPFTNCTHCGPRFSIIESLPYDRANTSMKAFAMCPECEAEYHDPSNRRFHAQPNACPKCGPQLELWDATGEQISAGHDALLAAAEALRAGKIVAVKGIGGFHLMVAAHNDTAVRELRRRKHREEQPLALMFPSLAVLRTVCEVSAKEQQLLESPEAPIVLLKKIAPAPSGVGPAVAPGNPYLGAMLPYSPLHHVLMAELGFPVVATSGNLSDEPICTAEHEALRRLHGIADVFLVHNRPIVRHEDDSITRVTLDREVIMRRGRGYAPLPVRVSSFEFRVSSRPEPSSPQRETQNPKLETILAVGAHLKNSVALLVGDQAFTSQHIGDLDNEQAFGAFRTVIEDLEKLYEAKPDVIACDLHPDYLSSQHASRLATTGGSSQVHGKPTLIPVQHHVAHVFSCMAENELSPPLLGISWDGTGYGTDGTIWGGEFFHVTNCGVDRVVHLRPFRLPGGDRSVKEPRRTGLGLLHAMLGDQIFTQRELKPVNAFSAQELTALKRMLNGKVNSPLCSSMGRLFDAVAAILGLNNVIHFEGQAAMELEFVIGDTRTEERYPMPLSEDSALVLDWQPMIEEILDDLREKVPTSLISAKFHNTLVESAITVARHTGEKQIALSGGCFQNRYLLERMVRRLREEKFQPYWHQHVPTNDGGIALGQIMFAHTQPRTAPNLQNAKRNT
jgi:hydrogenase maturation protein HypF